MPIAVPAFRPAAALRLGRGANARRSVCARRRPRACTDNGEDAAAWAAWDRARSQPEEKAQSAAPRDPEAETDFWRGAARELGAEMAENPDAPPAESTQSEVWADARDVTAGVEAMQQRLADELEAYNPAQALQDYRAAARDITNTESEDKGAEPEADEEDPEQWDPDAAWAQFDAAVAATGAERKAREARNAAAAFDYSPTPAAPAPPAPPAEPEDVTREARPAQHAQTAQPVIEAETFVGSLEGDEEFAPRDPKKETDFWRSAARELIPDQPPTRDVEQLELHEAGVVADASGVDVELEPRKSDWGAPLGEEVVPEEQATDSENSGPSAWDTWNKANAAWAQGLGLEGGPFAADNAPRSGDWGAGLRNTGTDEARWRAWDNANAPKAVKRENRRAGGAGALGEDTMRWMRAARQVTGKEVEEEGTGAGVEATEGVPRGQVGLGVGVEFWAKAAREMVVPETEESLDAGEEEEE